MSDCVNVSLLNKNPIHLRTQITRMDKNKFGKYKVYGARINEKIRIPTIRVINEEGKMLGIMSPKEALEIAKVMVLIWLK